EGRRVQLDWIRIMQGCADAPDREVDGEGCGRKLLAQDIVADGLKDTEQVVAAYGKGEVVIAGQEDIGHARRVRGMRIHVDQHGKSLRQRLQLDVGDAGWKNDAGRQKCGLERVLDAEVDADQVRRAERLTGERRREVNECLIGLEIDVNDVNVPGSDFV